MTHAACQRRAWKDKQPKRARNTPEPFDVGWHQAALHWAALATRGSAPAAACPYRDGDPAMAEYDRGWRAALAKFAREDRRDARHAHHTPDQRSQDDPARGLQLDGGQLGRPD